MLKESCRLAVGPARIRTPPRLHPIADRAVNLDATGTPPGAVSRTLTIGTNVIYKERVQTSSSGSAQIMLPDSSTLNVGRNSNIVIDEYVSDPNAGTGKMVATVAKGVMRFVGGQISHTVGVTVNTPVATPAG